MKSYKDIDKDIILNAPEGAMWVGTSNSGEFYYYTCNLGNVYIILEQDSQRSMVYPHLVDIQESDRIPLPNVDIPWEATEDSKCPVPVGIYGQARYADDFGENYYNPIMELVDFLSEEWRGTGKAAIVSYKIIDEDYLPSVATVTITEDSATIEPGVRVTVWQTVEDKLTKRLEFLQNLANKFPEVRNEAIKFMECELDGYMNTLWEKDNDE